MQINRAKNRQLHASLQPEKQKNDSIKFSRSRVIDPRVGTISSAESAARTKDNHALAGLSNCKINNFSEKSGVICREIWVFVWLLQIFLMRSLIFGLIDALTSRSGTGRRQASRCRRHRDHYQFTRTKTPAPRLASLLFYWGSTSDSLSVDKPRGIGLGRKQPPGIFNNLYFQGRPSVKPEINNLISQLRI